MNAQNHSNYFLEICHQTIKNGIQIIVGTNEGEKANYRSIRRCKIIFKSLATQYKSNQSSSATTPDVCAKSQVVAKHIQVYELGLLRQEGSIRSL